MTAALNAKRTEGFFWLQTFEVFLSLDFFVRAERISQNKLID